MKRLLLLTIGLSLCSCNTAKKNAPLDADGPPPKLLAPSVKKIWIPAKLKDGGLEWESGHYVYRIERGTTWSR